MFVEWIKKWANGQRMSEHLKESEWRICFGIRVGIKPLVWKEEMERGRELDST